MNRLLKKIQTDWLSDGIIKTLPIFISTNLVAVIIWTLQISHHAMPLVLGIIAGGLVDLDNSLSGRFKNLILTLIAFATSCWGATLALSYSWLFIPFATICAFGLVMLGALGQRYNTIAFGTLAVAVYTSLTYSENSSSILNMAMILTGTLLYGLVAMLVHIIFPNRTVQENLARSYEALSDYLQAKSAYFDPDDDDLAQKQMLLAQANTQVVNAFDQTRLSLFYRLQRHTRQKRTQRMLRYYFTAQDILERASSSHYQYYELFSALNNSDLMFRFQRVLELEAAACLHIAYALRHGEIYQHGIRVEKALQGLFNSLNYHQEQGLKNIHRWFSIAENLRNIEGQLNQIESGEDEEQAVEIRKNLTKSDRLVGEPVSGFRNMIRVVWAQCTLSSQLFRHAVRIAFVVGICGSLVPLFQLDNKGYWILLTAIFVCQPNYSATKKRLIQRVVGTILGVLFGMLVREYYITSTLEAKLGLIVISGSLYTFFRFRNYGFSTCYITILVLVSLDITGIGADEGILPRVLDTLVGTAIAWFAVSFIYPDWKYLNLHENLKNTLKASGHYLRHIMAQLQFGYNDNLPYRIARRDVQNYISALSGAISNMHSEPKKYQDALSFAPTLLGVTYTLLSYISALGAYRIAQASLDRQLDFSALFYTQGREVANWIERIAEGKTTSVKMDDQLAMIAQELNHFEQTHQQKSDASALVLIQQLRLIVELLPQLQTLVAKEKRYHQQEEIENKAD